MTVIDALYAIIGTPLGYIMWVCYLLVSNFGLAIILFTLIVKAAMIPLTLKQQKNMAASQLFTPRVKEIQTKYKNNREKQQEEMAKLQKEGYNPMGGCAPMIITMLLLFGVIDVVYRPMTHMEHMGETTTIVETRAQQTETALQLMSSPDDKAVIDEFIAGGRSIALLKTTTNADGTVTGKVVLIDGFVGTPVDNLTAEDRYKYGYFTTEELTAMTDASSRLSKEAITALTTVQNRYKQLQRELFSINIYSENKDAFANLSTDASTISAENYTKLEHLSENMYFLGINLGQTPKLEWNILIIVPIISFLFSVAQMLVSQWIQKKTNPDLAGGGGTKALIYIMPLFSLYITFIVPAGVGFYWAVSYLFGIAQSLAIYKLYPPEKMREDARKKLEEKSAQYTTTATIVDIDESGNKVERTERLINMSQKEQKEYYRKKLEEARKADAEKYGEDYTESNDDE